MQHCYAAHEGTLQDSQVTIVSASHEPPDPVAHQVRHRVGSGLTLHHLQGSTAPLGMLLSAWVNTAITDLPGHKSSPQA